MGYSSNTHLVACQKPLYLNGVLVKHSPCRLPEAVIPQWGTRQTLTLSVARRRCMGRTRHPGYQWGTRQTLTLSLARRRCTGRIRHPGCEWGWFPGVLVWVEPGILGINGVLVKHSPCRLPRALVAVELGILGINGVLVKQTPAQMGPLVSKRLLC